MNNYKEYTIPSIDGKLAKVVDYLKIKYSIGAIGTFYMYASDGYLHTNELDIMIVVYPDPYYENHDIILIHDRIEDHESIVNELILTFG